MWCDILCSQYVIFTTASATVNTFDLTWYYTHFQACGKEQLFYALGGLPDGFTNASYTIWPSWVIQYDRQTRIKGKKGTRSDQQTGTRSCGDNPRCSRGHKKRSKLYLSGVRGVHVEKWHLTTFNYIYTNVSNSHFISLIRYILICIYHIYIYN